ncbi:division/cell wall cluster transcriptional repressor MraZ [Spirochaeta thermophila]|uniref:Transcriptional regulator MraZ n=2 Tax=Winmispira thermophila TaxID=154 RepID=G0GCA5_WINT7|nr:division/cell wall cluster transcriptional repressor MraZ [Spirochaeta thermophila]ADN01838.1 protein MraZ [Spirochaeta thermophila DSM 6192]AEJ61190.1 Protein mraZ [Spirochaeta thermophila DSM 6578]
MITGEFRNTLDDKGRLLLPSKMRVELPGNSLILTRGIDRCLWLFPPEEWARISENLLTSISPFQQKARLLQRRIVAPAQEVEIDKAGRITVPQAMREFAGLQRDVVILGIKKYIELWDAEELERYWELHEEEFQEAAEDLGKMVFF